MQLSLWRLFFYGGECAGNDPETAWTTLCFTWFCCAGAWALLPGGSGQTGAGLPVFNPCPEQDYACCSKGKEQAYILDENQGA